MFLATRIVNGLVALLSLFMVLLLLPALELPTAMGMIIVFGSVALLYLLDLIFRRKNTKGDVGFAVVWTLFFTYAVYRGLLVLATNMPEKTAEDPIYLYGTFITVYVVPCILNSIYLGRLIFQKRNIP